MRLTKDGKAKTFSVNRLVALMFVPNDLGKPEVNHKDTNKLNNHASNLEWCTTKENIQHAYKNGLRDNSWNMKKTLQYDKQGNFIKEWKSATEAGLQLKINIGHISDCCRRDRNTAGGYIWRYKDTQ